jgi:hypothetical protein
MSRKLTALNLLLLIALGAVCWKIYDNWRLARARQQAFLARHVPAAPIPAVQTAPPPKPIQASNYLDIALNMLFSSDRNPEVIIEDTPAAPPPPPPFPYAYGLIDFGDGPFVLLAEKPQAPQKRYRPGDRVGGFTLVAVSGKEIIFEWDGKQFPKTFEELRPKEASEAPSSSPAPAPAAVVSPAASESNPAPAPRGPTTPQDVVEQIQRRAADGGPGINVGGLERPCAPGDTAPPGTVQGGYRKVVSASPFGQKCFWVPVR